MGKFKALEWAPIAIGAATLFVVLITGAFGANGWFHDKAKDLELVQAQVALLQKQKDVRDGQISSIETRLTPLLQLPALLQRLNDKLDASPRADLLNSQLTEIQKHLSALDGRMDGMEARIRDDETRIIRDDTRIDSIEKSSKEPLGNRR